VQNETASFESYLTAMSFPGEPPDVSATPSSGRTFPKTELSDISDRKNATLAALISPSFLDYQFHSKSLRTNC